MRITFAFLHLLTLGIGFYAIWTRANALKKVKDPSGLPDVFRADNIWALAAMLWIVTGLWRAFGGLEKGSQYYLHSSIFIFKITMFLTVFALEISIMGRLIKWRRQLKKGELIDLSSARRFAIFSHFQLGIVSIIVLLAVIMARGGW
jgi:putative membrane protein